MRNYLKEFDNYQRSGPHRRVEKILDGVGISYVSEEPFPPFTVDIYLPEWHLGVEIDGPYHQRKKDKVRDEYLNVHYGLPVLRISGTGWIKRQAVERSVVEFIEENSETSEERKQLCQKVR